MVRPSIIADEEYATDFQPVQQIFLEQNYRSTGAILGAALAIVRQGKLGESYKQPHPLIAFAFRHEAHQQVSHDFAPVWLVRRAPPGSLGA